jgi:hypothetical protein
MSLKLGYFLGASDAEDNDSNTAPADDTADDTADQGTKTAAILEIVDSLPETPLPYMIIPTASGGNLECGLYALVNSIISQLPNEAPHR